MRNLINLTEAATATPRSPTSLRASAKLDSKINFSVVAPSSHSSFGYHSIMLTEFGDFSDLKPKNGKVERAKAILHAELYDFKELARKMQRVEIDDVITCMCPFYGQDKVCVGTQNGSILIVNLTTQDKELLEHNTASKESISAIALTSDNKYLATGGEKGSLSLFDLENKVLKYALENSHNGKISAVLLTQNSKRVMAASVEGSVKVYDIGTLNVLYNFPSAQKNGINLMARTFDDHYLILASGNTAKMINLKGKSEFDIPNDSHENITSLIVTSDSKSVIFGTASGTIKIYSIPRKRTLHTLRASQNLEAITSLAITSDGCYLFASSRDGYAQFINLVSNEKIGSVANLHPELISCATFTNNNRYLITGSHDKCLKILHLKQHDECIETIKNAHTASITAIALTPEEKYVISASLDKSICTIDLDDAKVIHKLDGSGSNNIIINCLAMASKVPKLIAGCIDGSIRIFDRKIMNLEHVICDAHTEQINAIAVTADDKLIVSGSEDKSVKIFDLETRVCVYMFEDYFKGPVTSIAITPNNKYIICGSQDCCIKGFELKNKVSALGFLHAHTGAVTCLAVSSDNEYIVSGSADKSIRVFDIKYEECIHVFENAHHDTITAIAIPSNGKYIVSASLDGLIKVFDWKNRRCIHSFLGNGGEPITALIVSKDAWEITSASKYGSISLSINPLIRMEKSISTSETESMAAYKTFFDLLTLWKFLDKSTPCSFKQKFIKANPKAILYPEGWNLFHLVTLFNDHSLELLSACIEAKVPFTIDSFAMTPLHHLILAKNKDLQAINCLLSRFGEIVPIPNSLAVVSSLSNILPSIVKINNASVAQFLQCSTAIPPSYQYHKVPKFGSILKGKHSGSLMIQNDRIRITSSTDNIFNYKIRDKLIDPQGTSQLALEMLQFEMDFADPSSDDLFRIANMLNSSKVDNSDIFNTPAVSILIDFLWAKHKLFFQIQLLLFSALVALISIYGIPSIGNQQLCIEILIFCMSIYFLMAEVVQYWAIKRTISFWFHFSSLVLVYIPVMIIVIWALEDKDIKHWLVSFALLGAYSNWVSFIKVFDQTRNLIHIIFETGRDIRSFLIILFLIIVGFSLMMYQFDTDGTFGYGDRFLAVYSLLYGQYDTDDFNTPQVVYLTIVTVILAVVLLNLLVAIMTETYTRVQSSRNLTDSKERLKMIVGAMSFKRKARKILRGYLILLRRRTKYAVPENSKGFLYFVKKSKQEIAESAGKNKKWENNLNQIKTILKGEAANIEAEFKEQIERQEQRLIEHFKSQFEQQFRIQQEKLDDMMHYIKRMKMDNDKSSVAEEELPPLRLRSYASDTAHARELHVFGKLKG